MRYWWTNTRSVAIVKGVSSYFFIFDRFTSHDGNERWRTDVRSNGEDRSRVRQVRDSTKSRRRLSEESRSFVVTRHSARTPGRAIPAQCWKTPHEIRRDVLQRFRRRAGASKSRSPRTETHRAAIKRKSPVRYEFPNCAKAHRYVHYFSRSLFFHVFIRSLARRRTRNDKTARCCSCAREATSVFSSAGSSNVRVTDAGNAPPACNAISDGERARARVAYHDEPPRRFKRALNGRRVCEERTRTYIFTHDTEAVSPLFPFSLFLFLFFFFVSALPTKRTSTTTKNARSHVGCTSHWEKPATTACRLPWRRTRASAKVRPHWVKAKAPWWGSRLARQSMHAVVASLRSGARCRTAVAISPCFSRARAAAPCYARASSLSRVTLSLSIHRATVRCCFRLFCFLTASRSLLRAHTPGCIYTARRVLLFERPDRPSSSVRL